MKNKGRLSTIAKRVLSKGYKLNTIGNDKAGASLLRSKNGAELQAGIGDFHVGAGYDKKNRSAGLDVKLGKKRFNKSFKY